MKESTKAKMESMVKSLQNSKLSDGAKKGQVAIIADSAEASNGLTHEQKVELTADNVFNMALSMGAMCITMQDGNDKIDALSIRLSEIGTKFEDNISTLSTKLDAMTKSPSTPKTKSEMFLEARWSIVVTVIGLAVAVAVAPGIGDVLVKLAALIPGAGPV